MTPERARLLMVAAAAAAALAVIVVVLVLMMQGRAAAPPAAPAPAAAAPLAAEVADAADQGEAAPPSEAKLGKAKGARKVEAAPPSIIVERLGTRRVSCVAACALEASCGFRATDDCVAQSCEGELRKVSRADFELAQAADCAAAAASPCEEACWRKGECAGHHDGDARCTSACRTLVRQEPADSYRENRCIIERPCAELPLCAQGR